MKYHLLLAFVMLCCMPLYSQDRKASYTLEYSLNRSGIFHLENPPEMGFAHNVFAKVEFPLKKNMFLTTGIGYMNVHYYIKRYSGLVDFKDIETHTYYNYLVCPLGLQFKFGSFFILPELGLAYNIGDFQREIYYDAEMVKHKLDPEPLPSSAPLSSIKVVVPAFLTAGVEVETKNITFLLGLRGFVAVNNISKRAYDKHFYGAGIMIGCKI